MLSDSRKSIYALGATIGLILIVPLVIWLMHPSKAVAPRAIRVVDSVTQHPIAHAHVISANPKIFGFTDEDGLYLFEGDFVEGSATTDVIVSADGYYIEKVTPSVDQASRTVALRQITKEPDVSTKVVRVPGASGPGASWGPPYTVCSETAPDGYRVTDRAEFHLEGERHCGAWAECRLVEKDNSHVCWEFRLQGHSDNRVTSVGVLTVPIEKWSNSPEQLGEAYWMGRGVPLDYGKALASFRVAANQGDGRAMANIGWMYELGLGVEQNYGEAIKWYMRAADQGDTIANWNIARLYEYGQGVSRDLLQARSWYQKCADRGDKRCQEALKNVGNNPP